MKVYDIFDSGWLGVYQERAMVIYISDYRTVTERQWICEMVTERFKEPDRYVHFEKFFPEQTITKDVWIPQSEETRTRVVPGHYEERTETTPAHWGTREYWLEPQIEIQYRFVGTSEQRAGRYGWEQVDGDWEFVGTSEQRAGRAGWESYEVEIPGCWEERRIWFPDVTRTYDVLVPEHEEEYSAVIPGYFESRDEKIPAFTKWVEVKIDGEWVTKEHLVCHWKDVKTDQPIYSYYYPEYEYEVLDIERGPVMVIVGPPAGDKILLQTPVSKVLVEMEGKFLGNAVRIEDNKYVLPVREPEEPVEAREPTEEELEKIKWGD